jgi:hypothetical protein
MKKTEVEVPDQIETPEEKIPIREWLPPSENSAIQRQYQKFRVIRPFYLKTKSGPPEKVPPGQIIELADPVFITEMFCTGKIEPSGNRIIPESAEYSAVKSFQCILDGLYKEVRLLDILELSREEAIPLLKYRKIKPLDDQHFCLP